MRLWPRRRHEPEFSHAKSLRRLKEFGFAPKVIYDIGAYHGEWSKQAAAIFPSAEFVLFEANPANEPWLKAGGQRYFIAALAAEEAAERTLFLPKSAVATGASLYRENSAHYAGDNLVVHRLATRRLDAVVAEHDLARPDLVKIDVQGAECDVLAGAGAVLASCSALIVEMSLVRYNDKAPLLAEIVAALDRLGFRCADLCEVSHSSGGVIWQIDMLFVNAVLFQVFHERSGLT